MLNAICSFPVDNIVMADERVGWAIRGPTTYRTDDGGDSFRPVHEMSEEKEGVGAGLGVDAFAVRGPSCAWRATLVEGKEEDPKPGVGFVRVLRTTDGGKTWASASASSKYDLIEILSLEMTSDSEGRLDAEIPHGMNTPSGTGPTFVTHDGGATWREVPRPVPRGWGVYQECSMCERVLTKNGTPFPLALPKGKRCLARLEDMGGSVAAELVINSGPHVDAGGEGILTAQCPLSSELQNEAEETTFAGVAVFRIASGEAKWSYSSSIPEDDAFVVLKSDLLWRVTTAGILESNDRGQTWQPRWVPPIMRLSGTFEQPRSARFVSPRVGWLLAGMGCIHRTQDGGATWTALPAAAPASKAN